MPTLSTLSDDLRREIVECLLEWVGGRAGSHYREKNETRFLKNLSLVCHSLNYTCGYFIFRKYHLDLRIDRLRASKIYPAGSNSARWDDDVIKIRLAHLQHKAPFVREIHLTDRGELQNPNSEAFPATFMPELLATLRMLPKITAIHLATRTFGQKSLINADLWEWVLFTKPTTFSLYGRFKTPEGQVLKQMANLDTLGLHYCGIQDTIPLFNCQNLTSLSLTYGRMDNFFCNPEMAKLERITIAIDMWKRDFTNPLFDFSNVPHAFISVGATFYVQYKMNIPSAWRQHKPNLQRMFVEDLEDYDVARVESCAVLITRRSEEDWEPQNQIHLEDPEEEDREARAMSDYYNMRMQQQFGWLAS